MNLPEIKWDPRAAVGVPIIVGVSFVAVGGNCLRKLPEATVDIDGEAGCVVSNFKIFNPGNSLVTVSGNVSGSQVQMNMVQAFDAIDSARAVIDLSRVLQPNETQPLSSFEYWA